MKVKKKTAILISAIIVISIVAIALLLFLSSSTKGTSTTDWIDPVTQKSIGIITQSFVLKYQDGTTESLYQEGSPLLWIYYNGKIIEKIQYIVEFEPYTNDYVVDSSTYNIDVTIAQYETNLTTVQLSDYSANIQGANISVPSNASTNVIVYEFDPFSIIDYTFDDGDYKIIFTPKSSIAYSGNTSGWKNLAVLEEISFNLEVKDERAIGISFSTE